MAYSDGDCMLIACVWFSVAILDGILGCGFADITSECVFHDDPSLVDGILGCGLADMTSECVFHYDPSLGTLAVSHHFGRAP